MAGTIEKTVFEIFLGKGSIFHMAGRHQDNNNDSDDYERERRDRQNKLWQERPLQSNEILELRRLLEQRTTIIAMVDERKFYRKLWGFLGRLSAYASGIAVAIYTGRDLIGRVFQAIFGH